VMGSGQKILTRVCWVKFLLLGSGRVASAIFGWVWIWKISPKQSSFSTFCPLGKKNVIIRVKKYPGQSRVGLLCGSKVCPGRVGSGPISSTNPKNGNNF